MINKRAMSRFSDLSDVIQQAIVDNANDSQTGNGGCIKC